LALPVYATAYGFYEILAESTDIPKNSYDCLIKAHKEVICFLQKYVCPFKNVLREVFLVGKPFTHVAAAIQLASRGKNVKEGDDISFIYRDSEHHNPLCRATPLELADANVNFDRKKYCEMLLDAAETVLSTFSFPREAYNTLNRPKSWLKELREEIRNERMFEVDMEVSEAY